MQRLHALPLSGFRLLREQREIPRKRMAKLRHTENGPFLGTSFEIVAPLFNLIARRWLLIHGQDSAGFGLAIEMQFDTARVELTHDGLDATLDRRMVRTVAGDEFLDNGPQRRGRQERRGDAHGVSILRNTKSVITSKSK